MTPEFYRADGDWTPLRLGRVGWFLAGAGFPHEFQGVEDAELPFFKVGDTNLPGNEQELRSAPNTVSRLTARQLGARICPAGAIAFPKVGATLLGNKRRLTVRDCIFDNNMMALVPRAEHDPRFLLYALGDLDFGQLSNPGPVPSINAGDLKDVFLPIPAPPTQRAIAAFLDRKTAAIDALIAKKERLIELLQEKRQALITQAVTRGLNPSVPMKQSGIPSYGHVPAHWELKRLMHLTPSRRQIMYGIVLPGPNVAEGIPIVKSGDCVAEKLRLDRLHRTTPEIEAPFARARLEPGDIVYAIRGSIGMAAIVPPELRGANLTQDAARIAPRSGMHSRWLLYVVQSSGVWSQLQAGVVGATVKGINIRDLKRPVIPVPPPGEQDLIASFLDGAIGGIDKTRAPTDRSVELLREFRQALITAAVTGKIDVSKEAA